MQLVDITKVSMGSDSTYLLCTVVVDLGDGEKEYPFVYREGDTNGLSPQVASWLSAHPDVTVEAYETPESSVDPSDYPLIASKFKSALIDTGTTLSAVLTAISAIADETLRNKVQIRWEDYATPYTWPETWASPATDTVQVLLEALGMTEEIAATFWLAAKDI